MVNVCRGRCAIRRAMADARIKYSVVMPIFNMSATLRRVLAALAACTTGSREFIFVLDGCTDDSEDIVRAFDFGAPVTILVNAEGVFETAADNQGFRVARGEYIIEVQADMEMTQSAYNEALCEPLEQFADLIAVSARCCHTLRGLFRGVGKLGRLVERPHQPHDGLTLHLSHTVNRGPLALRRSMLADLGFLDEDHYVLGNDEHDLFARAWVQRRWRTAFFPVEFSSPLSWGATRRPRPQAVQAALDAKKAREPGGFLASLRYEQCPPAETRRLLPRLSARRPAA